MFEPVPVVVDLISDVVAREDQGGKDYIHAWINAGATPVVVVRPDLRLVWVNKLGRQLETHGQISLEDGQLSIGSAETTARL